MKSRSKSEDRQPKARESLSILEPNAAGIDVGSKAHWVAIPVGRDERTVRSFSAYTKGLHELADWLLQCGIETVAMESTGVYWVALYEVLQERGLRVCLVNAQHLHHVPGRKSDVMDCRWIQQLHSFGLLRASFRPGPDFVALRTYLRHREGLVRATTKLIQHMQKALTLMNLKLDRVLSDVTGETGMRILRDIVTGERDPHKLAAHRDPRCKSSEALVLEALRGNYQEPLVFTLRHTLELYDHYQDKLKECDQEIQRLVDDMASKAAAIDPPEKANKVRRDRRKDPKFDLHASLYRITGGVDLYQVTGIAELTAVQLIAEIGTDMSRWPDAKHFASWATLAPGCRITGGRRYRSRRPRSAHRVAQILRMAAVCAGRTQSAFGAFYRRLTLRVGTLKAVVATAAKLARILYSMLRHGTRYQDPGASFYEEKYRARVLRNLHRKAALFGLQLVPATTENAQCSGAVS
jgi:transposase